MAFRHTRRGMALGEATVIAATVIQKLVLKMLPVVMPVKALDPLVPVLELLVKLALGLLVPTRG
jgi:hypothetical protein